MSECRYVILERLFPDGKGVQHTQKQISSVFLHFFLLYYAVMLEMHTNTKKKMYFFQNLESKDITLNITMNETKKCTTERRDIQIYYFRTHNYTH